MVVSSRVGAAMFRVAHAAIRACAAAVVRFGGFVVRTVGRAAEGVARAALRIHIAGANAAPTNPAKPAFMRGMTRGATLPGGKMRVLR